MIKSLWSTCTEVFRRRPAFSSGLIVVALATATCSPACADEADVSAHRERDNAAESRRGRLQADGPVPVVVGWAEKVCLYPGAFTIPAKVDTGAVSCSLHAADPERYDRDGQEWVRFRIKDCDGQDRTIDQQIVGTKRIKRHFGGFQRRPVIRLGICLGTIYKEVDVNLVDRTGFEYPMLIGRNFMGESLVVNPSVKNTVEPTCPNVFHLMPQAQ